MSSPLYPDGDFTLSFYQALETQQGQIIIHLNPSKNGTFPSDTIPNLKNNY